MKKLNESINLKKIQSAITIKKHLDKVFYPGHSLVTYDLVLSVLDAWFNRKDLTIKEICTNTSRSVLNTRKHINYLLSYEWIELYNGEKDKRHRLIRPTQKLINLISELREVVD
jgi:DNA-binding MarR family transcriptional regulator